jgi:outer membrane lipoprotein-sorting protein
MRIILFILLILNCNLFSQANDPYSILKQVKEKFSKVRDYEVDVKIKVDISFLKMPEATAKIFFKYPNKVKLQSEGFAMLPKQGISFSPASLLSEGFTAIYAGVSQISDVNTDVIKVLPPTDTTDIVLSTLWVDRKNYIIRKVETSTKKSGTFQIELEYNDEGYDYGLPSSIKFSFDIPALNFPKGMTVETDMEKLQNGRNKPAKGTVLVTYSNYKVNKEIEDSFFEEKK